MNTRVLPLLLAVALVTAGCGHSSRQAVQVDRAEAGSGQSADLVAASDGLIGGGGAQARSAGPSARAHKRSHAKSQDAAPGPSDPPAPVPSPTQVVPLALRAEYNLDPAARPTPWPQPPPSGSEATTTTTAPSQSTTQPPGSSSTTTWPVSSTTTTTTQPPSSTTTTTQPPSSTTTTQPPQSGACPDPRYCADYYLNGGAWPADGSGIVSVHYRINPGGATRTNLTVNQIIQIIHRAASTWMAADPTVRFVYDGTTTDQAIGFNNVVGFQIGGGGGIANIQLQRGPDGHSFSGFDVQLNATTPWTWQPCDPPAGNPCSPYPGAGIDFEAAMAHSWGHVLGHNDLASEDDRLLTDYGGIPSGPDCGPAGPVCRFADTLGLGDVLGARYMYPTSAPMPTLYYDQ